MANPFLEVAKLFSMTICGIILTVPLFLILFPITIFFWILSIVSYTLSYAKYKGRITRARGPDVIHGKENVLSLPIINIGVRISGEMSLEEIKTKVLRILRTSTSADGGLRYQKFMDLYGKSFGYYIYRDGGEFSIDNHIRAVDINDLDWGKEQVPTEPTWEPLIKKMLNKYGHEKFKEDVPQWELVFVKENDQRYTGLFRIHHSMADGIYLARMFCEEFLDKPIKLYTSYTPPSLIVRLVTGVWSFILLPFGIIKVALNSDENPLHGPKLTGTKKFFVTKPISVKELLNAKNKSGVTMNTILFTLISYGLENHFKRKSMLIKNVTALTPVPLQNPLKPIKMKNKFAVASMALPTHLADKETSHFLNDQPLSFKNQLTRLKSVQKILTGVKQDPSILAANTLMNTLCTVLPAYLAEALISAKGCTICISNVPGPREELHIWSGTQDEMMFWVPDRNPIGIGASFFSFNEQLRIGLIMDTGIASDPSEGEQIIEDFETEVANILQTVRMLEEDSTDLV